jgi:putative DNA primase/helicase
VTRASRDAVVEGVVAPLLGLAPSISSDDELLAAQDDARDRLAKLQPSDRTRALPLLRDALARARPEWSGADVRRSIETLHREACAASRPAITIGPLHEMVDAAIAALAPLDVFQRGGVLVDVVRDAEDRDGSIRPEGNARLRHLPAAHLKTILSRAADWQRVDAKGEPRRANVPSDVVNAVEARGQWDHVRPLAGVVEWPVLRPDGSVLCARGYDAATQLICEPTIDVQVRDRPTLEDARYASESLRELVIDSPFASPAHLAAWKAALLSVVARPAIDGPCPLTLIDANARGAGKTTLADLIGTIVTGRALPRRAVPDDAAEWRKSLLAIAGDAVLLIDNVTRLLASDALDAVLTGSTFSERLLGRNEQLSLPIRTVFVVTANNAQLSADMVRRSLHVRLESRDEQPERRDGWQHPDVLGHAREHRAALLGAALTILRAYVVAGRPHVELLPMGSYEAWSAVVRAALVWAGDVDPAATQEGLREVADTERDAIGDLLRAWRAHYGDRAITVVKLLGELDREALADTASALRHAVIGYGADAAGRLPTARRLGNSLARLRGRIVDGLRLERGDKTLHGVPWLVTGMTHDSADSKSNPSRERSDDRKGRSGNQSHSESGVMPDLFGGHA